MRHPRLRNQRCPKCPKASDSSGFGRRVVSEMSEPPYKGSDFGRRFGRTIGGRSWSRLFGQVAIAASAALEPGVLQELLHDFLAPFAIDSLGLGDGLEVGC